MKGRMLFLALAIMATAALAAPEDVISHRGELQPLPCDSPVDLSALSPAEQEEWARAAGGTLDLSPKPEEEIPECPPVAQCNYPCRPAGPCAYEDLGIEQCRIGPLVMRCSEGETVHRRTCTSCTHPEAMCWAIQPVSLVCQQGLQPHPIGF